MGEYLSGLGKTQLRIAETEKYPTSTFPSSTVGVKRPTRRGPAR